MNRIVRTFSCHVKSSSLSSEVFFQAGALLKGLEFCTCMLWHLLRTSFQAGLSCQPIGKNCVPGNRRKWCDWPLLKSTQPDLSGAYGPGVLCSVVLTTLESPNAPETNQYQYGSRDSDQCTKQVSNDRTFAFINGRSMVHSYDRKAIGFNAQWASWWNIHYSITALSIRCGFVKRFYLYHQVPVRDRLSSTNHKLLSRMAARHFIVYMRRFIHIYGYLQVYVREKIWSGCSKIF